MFYARGWERVGDLVVGLAVSAMERPSHWVRHSPAVRVVRSSTQAGPAWSSVRAGWAAHAWSGAFGLDEKARSLPWAKATAWVCEGLPQRRALLVGMAPGAPVDRAYREGVSPVARITAAQNNALELATSTLNGPAGLRSSMRCTVACEAER